jgi:hypothetical protein
MFDRNGKVYLLFIFFTAWSLNLFAGNNPAPPNIILIFCDDLGYADLSCYGSLWNQTPEIDKMAVEGVRFTDFYAGAPVCNQRKRGTSVLYTKMLLFLIRLNCSTFIMIPVKQKMSPTSILKSLIN